MALSTRAIASCSRLNCTDSGAGLRRIRLLMGAGLSPPVKSIIATGGCATTIGLSHRRHNPIKLIFLVRLSHRTHKTLLFIMKGLTMAVLDGAIMNAREIMIHPSRVLVFYFNILGVGEDCLCINMR